MSIKNNSRPFTLIHSRKTSRKHYKLFGLNWVDLKVATTFHVVEVMSMIHWPMNFRNVYFMVCFIVELNIEICLLMWLAKVREPWTNEKIFSRFVLLFLLPSPTSHIYKCVASILLREKFAHVFATLLTSNSYISQQFINFKWARICSRFRRRRFNDKIMISVDWISYELRTFKWVFDDVKRRCRVSHFAKGDERQWIENEKWKLVRFQILFFFSTFKSHLVEWNHSCSPSHWLTAWLTRRPMKFFTEHSKDRVWN